MTSNFKVSRSDNNFIFQVSIDKCVQKWQPEAGRRLKRADIELSDILTS